MDKFCKNCKWWGRDYKGVCAKEGVLSSENPKAFGIKARADDDQGLEVFFVTGPDFGCVHFEEFK